MVARGLVIMDRSKSRRLLIIRAHSMDEGGDIVVGDFVRPIWGGPLGFVESVKNGWATALRVNNPHGHRDIMEAKFFKRTTIR